MNKIEIIKAIEFSEIPGIFYLIPYYGNEDHEERKEMVKIYLNPSSAYAYNFLYNCIKLGQITEDKKGIKFTDSVTVFLSRYRKERQAFTCCSFFN